VVRPALRVVDQPRGHRGEELAPEAVVARGRLMGRAGESASVRRPVHVFLPNPGTPRHHAATRPEPNTHSFPFAIFQKKACPPVEPGWSGGGKPLMRQWREEEEDRDPLAFAFTGPQYLIKKFPSPNRGRDVSEVRRGTPHGQGVQH